MKLPNQTSCEHLNRLWKERGETASREAIKNFKDRTGKKGMLSVADQISALESAAVVTPRPASPLPATSQVAVSAPRLAPAAPLASTATNDGQPELRGQERVRASIRASFAKVQSGSAAALFKISFGSTTPEVRRTDDTKPELFGKARLQAGIRAQLEKQGLTQGLSKRST